MKKHQIIPERQVHDMAKRTLESLQKQYMREVPDKRRGPGGRRGPGPGGPGKMGGGLKPKNTKATVFRIMGYIGKYKANVILAFVFMIINTLSSLAGSYMLSPIINRIQMVVAPDVTISWTTIGSKVNSIIEDVMSTGLFSGLASKGEFYEVTLYVATALIILVVIYLIGVISSYLQGRLLLVASQNASEKIRNDLFSKLQTLPI